jgi:D-citramalate synthase
MDTTLRDGEQTSGVFSARKANCAIVTGRIKCWPNRIASARLKGEFQGVKGIMAWASTKGYETASKF